MPRISDAQAYWDQFDAATNVLAGQLARQLWLPRTRRRSFSAMIAQFEKQRISYRNGLAALERAQRRALKGPQAKEINTADVRLLRLLRRRLQMLQRISETLAAIAKGKPHPLYAPRRKATDLKGAQADALDTAMVFLHQLINPNPQSDAAKEIGCFADIPLSSALFMAHSHAAYRVALAQKRQQPLRFLDVGCGGGMKVLLAAEIFDRAEGFDFDSNYVEAAQKAMTQMRLSRCRVFHDNALSFGDYAHYDVIYFYQPMSDFEALEAMEARIARTARPGTILIAPYQRFLSRAEVLNCGRIAGAVFITATSQAEADILRGQAEKIGPQILRPAQVVLGQGVEWMQALNLGCAANGYLVEKSI